MKIADYKQQTSFKRALAVQGETEKLTHLAELLIQKSYTKDKKGSTVRLFDIENTGVPSDFVVFATKDDARKLREFSKNAYSKGVFSTSVKWKEFCKRNIANYFPQIKTVEVDDLLMAIKEDRFNFKNLKIKNPPKFFTLIKNCYKKCFS